MVKIVGFERKVGSFSSSPTETVAYDNHVIYVIDNSDKKITGFGVGQVKVKTSELQDIFGTTDLNQFLGKSVNLTYSVRNATAVLVNVEEICECEVD